MVLGGDTALAELPSFDDLLTADRNSVLAVDISGSMEGPVEATGNRKIDELRNVVRELNGDGEPVPMIGFGIAVLGGVAVPNQVAVIETIPEPQGNTPIGAAIRLAKAEGANHIVVVSDGGATDDAIEAAQAFGGPIDVYYVGDKGDYGERIMQEIARVSGGQCNTTTLGKPKELASGIRGLLTAGPLQITGGDNGPILL
jgi:hypothetical protein